MKTFQPLAVLLTIAAFGANAIALPTEAASTNALPTLELATITDGEGTTWLGLDKVSTSPSLDLIHINLIA